MKYICVHGHFYQPPRENAWLETIENQPSADPFHDWNERINFECYAPNAAARLLGDDERIKDIVNNYSRISFNFGPTLLSWLEENDPSTYQKILAADRDSQARFGGHGSALAQAYSHMILPLANERDIQTQIKWGIADFVQRFQRKPEGMWLAETAVDTPTLEAMAEQGLKFTVLAPRQAKAVRPIGQDHWHDTPGTVDPRRPYLCKLPSGREIALFFYDGDGSKAVAFEGLLNDGHRLAERLTRALDWHNEEDQLSHIATDGESYGHHHDRGEMALAAALDQLDRRSDVALTVYGQYLEKHPPEWEAQIHENSSWSCVHGVERWRSNCGCHTGGEAGWNQSWRGPLRDALDYVRKITTDVFEREAAPLFSDPWAARDDYIELVLDREKSDAWLAERAKGGEVFNRTRMLRLLEMQRHAMLMYTSCGWFFNEVSGIETLQILQYANRAIHLAEVISQQEYHATFEELLEQTPSNIHANAAESYRQNVKPARVGLRRVAMHFAAASLFEAKPEELELFNYRAINDDFMRLRAGTQRLAIGQIQIQSRLTFSEGNYAFAVLYLGQHHVIGGIGPRLEAEAYQDLVDELSSSFRGGSVGYSVSLINRHFGEETFTIWHLFRDEKRKILLELSERSLSIAASNFADVYYDNYQLMTEMRSNGLKLPDAFLAAVNYILPWRLTDALEQSPFDLRKLERIAADYHHWEHQWSTIDAARLSHLAELAFLRELERELNDEQHFQVLLRSLEIFQELKLKPKLWQCQNRFLKALKSGEISTLNQAFSDEIADLAAALKFEPSVVAKATNPTLG
ncbi:MAG: DUF3536 domain-containing protein [Bacteroidota bacterium]